jgi:hypothetical protein
MQILPDSWKYKAGKQETERLNSDILYQPRISNLESGDAFCVISDPSDGTSLMLIVLQITVSKVHKVKSNGLNEIGSHSLPQSKAM